MAQAKHTPGPWEASLSDVPYAELGECWVVDTPSGSVCTVDSPADDREANARLIAAAPDMVSALSNSLATLAAVYQWIDRVNDAGGATSISGVAACNAMLKSLNGNRDRFQKLIVDPGNAAIAKATAA